MTEPTTLLITPLVRIANTADRPHCQQLEQQAQGGNAGARGAAAFFAEQPISFISDDRSGFTLVAEVDGVVVGLTTVQISNVAGVNVATVVRVFVTALARRVGVGDALINAAKSTHVMQIVRASMRCRCQVTATPRIFTSATVSPRG
jgi:hypothetical protein